MKLLLGLVLFGSAIVLQASAQDDIPELSCGQLYYRTMYLDEKKVYTARDTRVSFFLTGASENVPHIFLLQASSVAGAFVIMSPPYQRIHKSDYLDLLT
jgi:hypothetical protein